MSARESTLNGFQNRLTSLFNSKLLDESSQKVRRNNFLKFLRTIQKKNNISEKRFYAKGNLAKELKLLELIKDQCDKV